jgi:hypothetical protein
MSWNNVIPWKVLDCMETCVNHDPATGYTIHVPGCKLGVEVAERNKRDCDQLCWSRDMRPDGGRYTHDEGCPIGQELKEQEEYERTKDRSGDAEEQAVVGAAEGQTGTERDQSGRSDAAASSYRVLYGRSRG